MNKILVILMCFNLMVSPVASAQGTANNGSTSNKSSAGGAPDPGKKGYLNQILSIGTAVVGTSVLTTCTMAPLIPSMVVFLSGSLAYVASEILGGKAHTEAARMRTEELKALEGKIKQGGDLQLASLEAALKNEQDLLAFANKRKLWLTAIMAIYSAATALAVVEAIRAKILTPPAVPVGMLAGCTGGGALGSTTMIQKSIIAAYSFGVGKAGGGISQFAAMGAALALTTTSLGSGMAGYMNMPEARIAFFGAAAGLTTLLMTQLGSKAGELKERVDLLQKLIAQFKKETKSENNVAEGSRPVGPGTINGEGSSTTNRSKKFQIKSLPLSDKLGKNCWTKSANGQLNYSSNCTKPIQLSKSNFDGSMNVPTLKSVSNLASDFGQAVADGNIGRADIAASELASMAGRIDLIKKDMAKKMNDSLLAKGLKPIDIDAEAKSLLASMSTTASKDLAKAGVAVGPGTDATVSSGRETETSVGPKDPVESNLSLAGSGVAEENLEISETPITEVAQVDTLEETLKDYETTESDIAPESDVSIFRQVSNRYLLNYDKIFNRKGIRDTSTFNE